MKSPSFVFGLLRYFVIITKSGLYAWIYNDYVIYPGDISNDTFVDRDTINAI
jgi:hypothetical protein